MTSKIYDLVVAGGGINGAGIAADAAGRGLTVLLAEAEDLAGGTSSSSSKLIHGGLRYLEHFEFRLVREALAEREVLLKKAPHIIWPLRFVLPHAEGMRAGPILSAGLFLYDHLASRRNLPASQSLDLSSSSAGHPLQPRYARGYTYWDCWVDDARLVIANVQAAHRNGADVLTRAPVTALKVVDGVWTVTLRVGETTREVVARAVINATGPWVGAFNKLIDPDLRMSESHVSLVKGSHIVVPKIRGADDAYIFQNRDGRVVFALPFEGDFTLIGTTDVPFSGDPRQVVPSDGEVNYLLELANHYFQVPLRSDHVVWSYAGVRPLADDGNDDPSAVSRDYRLELAANAPPLLHVIGGKITTYRRLAEAALARLRPYFPHMGEPWTHDAPLPGGDVGPDGFDVWFADFCARRPAFSPGALRRVARRYGTRAEELLAAAGTPEDLGEPLGGGLTVREVDYLKAYEWAQAADDVLWRRTKAALQVSGGDMARTRDRIQTVLDRS